MRIVPSDVTSLTLRLFPTIQANKRQTIGISNTASVAIILRMLEQVPEELLVLSGYQFSILLASIETLRHYLRLAEVQQENLHPSYILDRTPGFIEQDPITHIWILLSYCPDEALSQSTRGMSFISDAALRTSLLIDLGSAERALNNGEWKACTVLSGSIIEALLLWILQKHPPAKIEAALASVDLPKAGPSKIACR